MAAEVADPDRILADTRLLPNSVELRGRHFPRRRPPLCPNFRKPLSSRACVFMHVHTIHTHTPTHADVGKQDCSVVFHDVYFIL